MTEESLLAMWSNFSSWFTPTTLFLLLNLMIGTIVLSSKISKKNPTQQPTRDFNPTQNFFRASTILERVKSVNFSQYLPESPTVLQVEPTRTGSILERVKSFNFSFNPYNSESEGENRELNANNTEPDRESGADSPATKAELNAHRGTKKAKNVGEVSTRKKIYGDVPAVKKSSGDVPAKNKIPCDVPVKNEVSGEAPATKTVPGEAPMKKLMRSASEKMKFWRSYSEEEIGDDVELRRPATVRGGEGSEALAAGDGGECVDSQADDFINKFRQQLKLQRLDSMLRYSDMITRGSSR